MLHSTHIITPTGPFSFELALSYLRGWTASTFETIDLEVSDFSVPTWRRALRLCDQDVLLTARSSEFHDDPGLTLIVTGEALTAETQADAIDRVTHIFGVAADPEPFRALAERDPVLRPLVEPFPGLRPIMVADPFEALIWAVLGQQINVAFARTLKLRLVELCGRTLEVDGVAYPLMPTPEAIAALDPTDLLSRQYSRQKARYVIELSRAVASGELDLDAIATLPHDEAIAELARFTGIGRWTAEYLLMRAFAHPDAIPAGDVSLQLIIGAAVLGRRATEAEVREIAERWQPWRGWAAFFFWLTRQMGSTGSSRIV